MTNIDNSALTLGKISMVFLDVHNEVNSKAVPILFMNGKCVENRTKCSLTASEMLKV